MNQVRRVAADRDQITLAAQQQAAALEQENMPDAPEAIEAATEVDSSAPEADAPEAANG